MRNPYFKDKVAVVTGAGSGLGKALCEILGQQGAMVVATDIILPAVEKVAQKICQHEGRASARFLDVTNASAFEELIKTTVSQYGQVDLLFNNAGITLLGEVYDMTLEHWQEIINVNFNGVVHGIFATYPLMVQQGFGQIVNIASMAGLIGYPSATAYAATKNAIIGLSTSLRVEGAKWGVNINVVCPGYMDTNIFKSGTILNADLQAVLDRAPLKAMEPEVAARTVLRGVEKNKGLILFPFSSKLLWWVFRIHSGLLSPICRKLIEDLRVSKKV